MLAFCHVILSIAGVLDLKNRKIRFLKKNQGPEPFLKLFLWLLFIYLFLTH